MYRCNQFYIDGQWVDPSAPQSLDVINPADESVVGEVMLGNAADVDKAVAAARAAFPAWSQSTREERLALLERIVAAYKEHYKEIAAAITAEMGAPEWFASRSQAGTGIGRDTNKNADVSKDRNPTSASVCLAGRTPVRAESWRGAFRQGSRFQTTRSPFRSQARSAHSPERAIFRNDGRIRLT